MNSDSRTGPAGNGTGSDNNDLLTGDLPQNTADLAQIAADSLPLILGLLLQSPPLDRARSILDRLPAAPDGNTAWWLRAIELSVDELVRPNPATAAAAAIRAGYEPPPGLRGHVAAHGWKLVSEATPFPMACVDSLVDVVREGAVRTAVERALRVVLEAVWRGELVQLAELMQTQTGAALAMLAEAGAA